MKERIILCVDDEDIVLSSLKRELLHIVGDRYLIEMALTGEEALQQMKEVLAEGYEVPVAIVDHMMPGMKGADLLTHIHALSPKTVNILLTGQADLPAVIKAVNHGELYRYIAKPWESINLALTVKEAIHDYLRQKELDYQNKMLRQVTKTLEIQIKERTAELKAQQAELKQLTASKDKFFSILACDLRTPFYGLLDIIESISRHIDDFSQDEIEEHVSQLQRSMETVYHLLEHVQMWSDLQQEAVSSHPEDIVLAPVIARHIRVIAPRVKQKQIEIINQVPPGIVARVDPQMFEIILQNLLSNAVKFTYQGGHIRVSAYQNAEGIELAVSDTGTGIPEEDMSQLFRIDAKYSNTGIDGEPGTGLGLIVCQELVKKHHGQISVESEFGCGTRVTVQLPGRKQE